MVAAADRLRPEIAAAAGPGTEANLTGAAAMWADFNEANREAMLKSELISWPVTLAILVLAFGSLVAAGLPLMLTITGLVASAGVLYLGSLISPISIWAMNFALMFALALGIDYALFVVMRFRGALAGERTAVEAVAETMDSAGKAVLFSALTVLVSISAVLLVPSPAFRSVSLGIMVSVLFVLAATLTLLPAVLAKLGPRVDRLSLPWAGSGDRGSPRLARWGELLWRRPFLFGGVALVLLVGLALPALSLKTGMPSIKVVPMDDSSRVGYRQLSAAFGAGAPATMQVTAPRSVRTAVVEGLEDDPGIASVAAPVAGAGDAVLIGAVPTSAAATADFGDTVERLRGTLPPAALVGGAAAENHDLESVLAAKAPLAIGLVVGLGFLLLLIAFQAPLVAAIAVLANLLSTAAAFGVAKLIFQDGHLSGLLGFESQGFLDAWGPIFFFAMIFAIAMDYTVFLLSSAREQWERTGDAKEAMVGGLARSGRVVPRRRRGDGRGLLHLRPLGTAAPEGDGGDSRRRRPPRHLPGPSSVAAGVPAARRSGGLVDALLAQPHPARRPLRAQRLARTRPVLALPARQWTLLAGTPSGLVSGDLVKSVAEVQIIGMAYLARSGTLGGDQAEAG